MKARVDGTKWLFWKLVPKHHLFLHIVEEQVAVAGSPKACWCYPDESEIGLAAKVGASCHPRYLPTAVILKYRC